MEELEQLRKNAAAAGGKQKKERKKDTLKQHEAAKFLRVCGAQIPPHSPVLKHPSADGRCREIPS